MSQVGWARSALLRMRKWRPNTGPGYSIRSKQARSTVTLPRALEVEILTLLCWGINQGQGHVSSDHEAWPTPKPCLFYSFWMASKAQEKNLLPTSCMTSEKCITFPGVCLFIYLFIYFYFLIGKAGFLPSPHQSPFPFKDRIRKSACVHSQLLPLSSLGRVGGGNILPWPCRRSASGRPLALRNVPQSPYQLCLLSAIKVNFGLHFPYSCLPPPLIQNSGKRDEIWSSLNTPTPIKWEHFILFV